MRTWEEIQEAIRLIPGPVVPLIPAHLSPYPSLQAQQDAGAAAAWFPAGSETDGSAGCGLPFRREERLGRLVRARDPLTVVTARGVMLLRRWLGKGCPDCLADRDIEMDFVNFAD